MPLVLVTAPTVEPITLAEAKAHLRVDHTHEDTLISSRITSARQLLEKQYRRTFVNTTYDLKLDSFPAGREPIVPPSSPLVSVSSFAYIDTAGDTQTIPAEVEVISDTAVMAYRVDTASLQGRIAPTYGFSWPTAADVFNAITIRMVLGYGAAASNVPDTIKDAMLLLVAHRYENREPILIGSISKELEHTLESLLWADRAYSFS